MNKKVFIVGGANGAGKTTFAKEFIKEINITFLNADEIEKEFNPNDTNGGRIRAGKEFLKRTNNLINSNNSFLLESTLAGKYLQNIIKRLKNKYFEVILLYVFIDNSDLAIDRVKTRVKYGGHFVPDIDVKRRFKRSKLNFWNLYRYLVDEWQIYYNGDNNIIQICIGNKNKIIIINEDRYNLFKEGLENE